MIANLFRIKSVDRIVTESEKSKDKLKRTLTWVDLIFLGIGAIVGAGIFATIGTAAAGDGIRPGAGPALIVSFVLTGIACGFSAFCYAEFAAMVPIAGSAYTYAYATLGEVIAWIIGWDLIIEYAIGNVAVAISWSGYFSELLAGFGIILPGWMTIDYRTAVKKDEILHATGQAFTACKDFLFDFFPCLQGLWPSWLPMDPNTILAKEQIISNAPHLFGIPVVFNLPAVAIVTLLTVLIVIGIKESARFNEIMVTIKLIVLAFFCGIGYMYLKPENYTPFAPNGWAGIQSGAAIIFFAYIGFDAVSTLAEETKDPGKDLPIGIVGSLVVCTIIYILVTVVFCGLIPFDVLKEKLASEKAEPLTMAIRYIGTFPNVGEFTQRIVHFAAGIVAFGSVVAHTAVLLVFQIGQPRIFFSMARDGLLPKAFMSVHPTYKTPYFSTILTGVFVAGFAAFMNIDEMVDLCNIGTLFAFVLVCIGIIILRIREPNRKRPFKVPGGFIIPIFGVLTCLMLTYSLPGQTWLRFLIWLIVGLFIYVGFGYRNSRLARGADGAQDKDVPPELEDIDKF